MLNPSVNENRSIQFLYRELYSFFVKLMATEEPGAIFLKDSPLSKNVQNQQQKERKWSHMQFFAIAYAIQLV